MGDLVATMRERAGVFLALLAYTIYAVAGFLEFWQTGKFPESWLSNMALLAAGGFGFLTGKQGTQASTAQNQAVAETAAAKAVASVTGTGDK